MKWQWLFVLISVCTFIWAGVMWFFLVPEPSKLGFVIEELTEQEAIVEVLAERHDDIVQIISD